MLETKSIQISDCVFNHEVVYKEPECKNKKAFRADDVSKIIVEVDGLEFNADEHSINRMSRIINDANFVFIEMISTGTENSVAYDTVYNTEIEWKLYNNEIKPITIKQLAKAHNLALKTVSEVWLKYK